MKKCSYHFASFFIVFIVLQLAFPGCVQKNLSPDKKAAIRQIYLADLSQELNKAHPDNRIINIICIGNSVPAGYTKTPVVDPFTAYPYLLLRELKQGYPYAIINVIVSARGSETSDGGIQRFKKDVSRFAPDLITIDYGLTDRTLSLDKSRNNLSSMVGLAKKSGIKVLLLTPTPAIMVDFNDPNDPLNQQAEQIRDIAKASAVGLVDSYAVFKRYVQEGGNIEDILSNKINHPNRKGHEMVVKEIMKWFPMADDPASP